MKRSLIPVLLLVAFGVHAEGHAPAWAAILSPRQAIIWSNAGVDAIPVRSAHCADLTPTASVVEINAALASCPGGETVTLAAGTYSIAGTVRVPSNVTLR